METATVDREDLIFIPPTSRYAMRNTNPREVFKEVASYILSANLPISSASYAESVLKRFAAGEQDDISSLNIQCQRAESRVDLDIDDEMNWAGKIEEDADGNRFRKMTFKVKINGCSWGGNISNAIVLANLIQEVTNVAAVIEQIVNNKTIYNCFETAQEHKDRLEKAARRQNREAAEIVVQENSSRLRAGKDRTVRRGHPDQIWPASGEYNVSVKDKDYTVNVVDATAVIIRNK